MKVIKIVSYSLLLFLIFAALTFAALNYFGPDQSSTDSKPLETVNDPEIKAKFNLLRNELDSLKTELKNSQIQTANKQTVIDSLEKVLTEKNNIIETTQKETDRLNELLAVKKQKEDQAKALAKTFETMKTSEMGPLLLNLDDLTIIRIYENMNNRSRKNLLLALSERRASIVTKKIANFMNP